ncbi:metal ABC transporter substrate-binding protein [Anaerocolumna sedimenticola]|uniref:Metal ABC transporter substrate-binding protein n=1 Tax=Anaerocolumna sedimenticola TaxID=2696063 RepID=A0A6P1TRK6_9FIRM|nr:MetQ/NlpA family ABC transporter substrate-binding protein [Anaerocolumna sedimenticola]QHQ62551.1 metal ABC transporter substrate-binding protein [Anaerocolumna sedimenticola]
MKKIKRFAGLLLSIVLISILFTACGTKESGDTNNAGNETAGSSEVSSEATSKETAAGDTSKGELTEIVVGATVEPHATILNSDAVKNALAEQGYSIKVVEYSDYIQPNVATEDGSLDANFFQHVPYLDDYNKQNGTNLKAVANIHFEPLGIYPGKAATIDAVADGAQIAVPNDTSNEARALLLLEKAGLIKLKENIGLDATINDITENPKNLDIVEIEAAQTVKVLQDVDLAVINGNFALSNGLSASEDALLVEDTASDAAATYANVIVVKEGNEESDKTKALVKAVTSEETKKFINDQWKGAVIPVF